MIFEVTEGCNLRCKYCAFSDLYNNKERGSRNLPYSYACSLLNYLFTLWEDSSVRDTPTSTVISFYGGEPLLNFSLIEEIVEYIENRKNNINRKFSYSITTNAVLLPLYIDFFVKNNFNIMISLDGDECSDSYRIDIKGRPSFNQVYQNIKKIESLYPDFYSEHISFNAVLTNRNSYEGIVSFFQDEFGKIPHISALSTSNVNPLSREKYEQIRNRAQPDNSVLPFSVSPSFQLFKKEFELKSGNYYYDFNELLYNRYRQDKVFTGTCFPFSKKLYLTVEGKILQCERISYEHHLGFVNESEVHLDFNEVVRLHNAAIKKYSANCKKCQIRYTCPQCIYRADGPECAYMRSKPEPPFCFDNVKYNPAGALEAVYSSKTRR